MKTTIKILGIILINAIMNFNIMGQNYEIDKNETRIKWTGKKVTGQHYGTINLQMGTMELEDGVIKSGIFKMDMNSIVNEDLKNSAINKKLVDHLKSDDFFSVEEYPVSTLIVKEVKAFNDEEFLFLGDLTIKDITKPITFKAIVRNDNGKLKANGSIKIDRTLYNIRYGSGKFFASLGDNMIYDTFTLDFSVVANNVAEKELSDIN